jgi:hypothetical protein
MSVEKNELIVSLVSSLKERVGLEKLTSKTIHIVLKETMELVEELNIPGSEKRDNVLRVVKVLVEDLVKDVTEKHLILDIIENNVLENIMDLIVKASKGEININNKTTQKQLTGCFTVILRIIASLVTMCTKKSKDKTVKIVKSSNTDKI